MAINRFMEPWKRDFSSANYVPNFDAWAKVLAQKEQSHEKLLEASDKLATLIPEGGYSTTEARQNLLKDVRNKSARILDELYSTGDSSAARRNISLLANEITNDPWIAALNMDKELKNVALQIPTSQTLETDVQNAYDPKTGKFKQVTDPSQVNPGLYSVVKTQNVSKMFDDINSKIPAMYENLKTAGFDEIQVVKVKHEDGTVSNKYFLKGKNIQREFIDEMQLKKYLDPKGIYGAYAQANFRNYEGNERAYYDAKYKDLKPEEFERQFYRDLYEHGLIKIYDKSFTEDVIREVGGAKEKETKPPPSAQIQMMSYEGQQPVVLDKMSKDTGQFITFVNGEKRNLPKAGTSQGDKIFKNNIDIAAKNAEYKMALTRMRGSEVKEDLFVRTAQGTFQLNANLYNTMTDDEIAKTFLNADAHGVTVMDKIHNLNNEILFRNNQLRVKEHILEKELGISIGEASIVEKAYQNAQVKAEGRFFREGPGRGLGRSQYNLLKEKNPEQAEKMKADWILEEKAKLVESELDKLISNNPNLKNKLKKADDYLRSQVNEVNVVSTNFFYPLADTPDGERSVEMLQKAFMHIITTNQHKISIGDQPIIDPDKRKSIAEALNNFFQAPDGDKANYFKQYQSDIAIMQDKEDKYKLSVNLKNQAIAEALGVDSNALLLEVEIPKNTKIGNKTLEEYMGIEGNKELTARMDNTQQQFSQNQEYIAMYQDGDDSTVISLDVYNPERNKSVLEAKVDFDFDGKSRLAVKTPSLREANLLDLYIRDIKDLPKDPDNVDASVNYILQLSNGMIPEATARQLVNYSIGSNIINLANTRSPYWKVREGSEVLLNRKAVGLLNNLGRAVFKDSKSKLILTDGYRTEEENAAVNGDPASAHMSGMAFDVAVTDDNRKLDTKLIESIEDLIQDQLKGKSMKEGQYYEIKKYGISVMRHIGTADHFHFKINQ